MKNQNIEKVAVPEDIRALRFAYRDALMMSKDVQNHSMNIIKNMVCQRSRKRLEYC